MFSESFTHEIILEKSKYLKRKHFLVEKFAGVSTVLSINNVSNDSGLLVVLTQYAYKAYLPSDIHIYKHTDIKTYRIQT